MTSRIIIISLFALAGLGLALIARLSHREGSRIPTIGQVSGFVMQYQVGRLPVGRIAVLGFWWWIGWHFFAR